MKLTVIYDDKFIRVDDKSMHFVDNWPFNEEHIHAIQWDGKFGELELRTREPNIEFNDQSEIQKYIDFFNLEFCKWEEKQKQIKEQEELRISTWHDAMKELEMQVDHLRNDRKETIERLQAEHERIVEEHEMQHEIQIERIFTNHENLYDASNKLASNMIVDSDTIFENITNNYDNVTVFDGSVDPHLFDDSIDENYFVENGKPKNEEDNIKLKDLTNFDISLFEEEFDIEMIFDNTDETNIDNLSNPEPGFNENAIDGDGDGIVQEGTKFERPISTTKRKRKPKSKNIEETPN